MPNVDLEREELEHLIGDEPDSAGPMGRLGLFDLTKSAYRVRVRYGDMMIFCEVFALPGEQMHIHWMCPRCGPLNEPRMSTIWGHHTKMDFDPKSNVADGGRLNVQAFKCPWELESKGRRMEFGLGMCGLRLAIDNSVARDA